MMRRTRLGVVAGAVVVAALGFTTGVQALWTSKDTAVPAPISVGEVSFGGYADWNRPQYSPDGSAVTLRLPGSQVAQVLDADEPMVWQLTVEGYATGIAGMAYDVTVASQIAPDGTQTDLTTGIPRPGTVLAASAMTVYPAGPDGDCSRVPEVAAGTAVEVVDGVNHTLQAPGTYSGAPVRQVWCVAIAGPPDGAYANRVDVTAKAANGTVVDSQDLFEATVRPDASVEPDITIVLNPTILRR